MLKLIVWIQNFLNKIRRDRISAYSGQSAYFIILSALPFILFLLTLVQHLPFTLEMIKDSIYLVIPEPYAPTVTAIFNDIHVESGTTLLSVSVIMTIWTAGKGIMAISGGLNSVQQVEENRPYLILRIKAAVYTLLFAVMIIFTVLVLVFGNRIYLWLQSFMPNMSGYSRLLNMLQSFIAIAIYFFMFTLFYKFLPAKRMNTLHQKPGAMFTTAGWMIGSYIFSLYVEYSDSSSYMYGSLSYLIFFFIYLYMLMYIFFLGAEINYFIFPEEKEDFHLRY